MSRKIGKIVISEKMYINTVMAPLSLTDYLYKYVFEIPNPKIS